MDDEIKAELKRQLQAIVEKFSGDARDAIQTIVNDMNTVLGQMITDPSNADRHSDNIKILTGNLSTRAAITVRETREMIAQAIQTTLTKVATTVILAI